MILHHPDGFSGIELRIARLFPYSAEDGDGWRCYLSCRAAGIVLAFCFRFHRFCHDADRGRIDWRVYNISDQVFFTRRLNFKPMFAIGVTFTWLFAIGVVLISIFAGRLISIRTVYCMVRSRMFRLT